MKKLLGLWYGTRALWQMTLLFQSPTRMQTTILLDKLWPSFLEAVHCGKQLISWSHGFRSLVRRQCVFHYSLGAPFPVQPTPFKEPYHLLNALVWPKWYPGFQSQIGGAWWINTKNYDPLITNQFLFCISQFLWPCLNLWVNDSTLCALSIFNKSFHKGTS